jgi:hypothetical protein
MKNIIKNWAIGFGIGISGLGVAAVTLPHTFLPGTPIKSAEMNAQFIEIAKAINSLEAQLNTVKSTVTTLESGKQKRVVGTCLVGSSIRTIDAEGNVECEQDDIGGNGGSFSAGAGLNFSNNVFSVADAGITTSKLADSSVNAAKILDEPAVAQSIDTDGHGAMAQGSIIILEQVTVQAPANGFVLVIGSTQVGIVATTNSFPAAVFGVSKSPTTMDNEQVKFVSVPPVASNAGNNSVFQTVSNQKIFAVNAGANTFYLLGSRQVSTPVSSKKETLSAVFIPSSMGIVEEIDPGTPPV